MEPEKVEVQLPDGMTQEQFRKALLQMAKKVDKDSPSEPILFKEIQTKDDEVIRVYRDVYKGREYLSIRKFWRKDTSEEYQPGKGITFPYDAIDDLIDGLGIMKDWCGQHPTEGE